MTLTALALVVACSPMPPEDHVVSSPQGRFQLDVKARSLTLRAKGAAAPRWKVQYEQELFVTWLVADSGAWVAALRSPSQGANQLTLFDSKGVATEVKLLGVLDEEEKQFLPWSSCGTDWLASMKVEGDLLTMDVEQGGNRRPPQGPGPSVRLSVDLKKGTLVRSPAVLRPSIAELIAQYGRDASPGALMSLRQKAELRSSQGNRALCDFFAGIARGKDVDARRTAISALGAAGCGAELSAVCDAPPRGDESDLAVFEHLQDSAAERYALQALTERRPPTTLRVRAAGFLIRDARSVWWDAAKLALSDPEPAVRQEAAHSVGRLPRSQEAFAMLLPVAQGEDAAAVKARRGVLGYFERGETRWRAQLIEAEAAGKLDRWPAAIVVVAGLAEVAGERSRAETLYRKAATLLDSQRPPKGYWDDAELWAEAKLRLAQLAANAGQQELALRLAHEVVASGTNEYAAAPSPNRYAGGNAVQTALTIANQLIKSGGAPLPPQRNTTR